MTRPTINPSANAATPAEPATPSTSAQRKPPLLLLHGFRGAPTGLQKIADTLRAAGYDVYTPAVPPFAGAAPLKNYSPGEYSDFVKSISCINHLERPVLIGHSMGSLVAAAAASSAPELYNKKLVLLSPISARPVAPIRALTPLSALLPGRAIDQITIRFLFVPDDHALFRETLKMTTKCSSDRPPKARDKFASARFSASHALSDFDLSPFDILLLAGAHDRLIPREKTETLAKTISKNAKTVFAENSGHLHNYEQPLATARAILDFLEN